MYMAIPHLIDYTSVKIFLCTGKPKVQCDDLFSIFTLLLICSKSLFSKVCPYFEYAIPSSLGLKVSDEKLCNGKFSCILLLYFLPCCF